MNRFFIDYDLKVRFRLSKGSQSAEVAPFVLSIIRFQSVIENTNTPAVGITVVSHQHFGLPKEVRTYKVYLYNSVQSPYHCGTLRYCTARKLITGIFNCAYSFFKISFSKYRSYYPLPRKETEPFPNLRVVTAGFPS